MPLLRHVDLQAETATTRGQFMTFCWLVSTETHANFRLASFAIMHIPNPTALQTREPARHTRKQRHGSGCKRVTTTQYRDGTNHRAVQTVLLACLDENTCQLAAGKLCNNAHSKRNSITNARAREAHKKAKAWRCLQARHHNALST